MKIIDGKDAVLGRLASYAAKEALKGEEVIIVNCKEVIITGNKKDIEESFKKKKSRVGSGQKGPKHSKIDYKIVKRTIRGMIPNHRRGRGKDAFKRIKCYSNEPTEFKDKEKIKFNKESEKKIKIKDLK